MTETGPEPGEITDRDGTLMVRVGNRLYPAKQVAQCKTCRSKYRADIEQGIINGMPYSMVMSEIVERHDDHSPIGAPNYGSVLRHVKKKHMAVPHSVQRGILEERAGEIGKSVEQGERLMVDSVAIHRTVIQRGFERLNTGEIQPNMNDLMTALRLQAAISAEQGGSGVDEDAWRDALMAYMEIVQRNVGPDVLQQIGREMAASPTLRAIRNRRQAVVGEIEE